MKKSFFVILILAAMIGALLIILNFYSNKFGFNVKPTPTPIVVEKEDIQNELDNINLDTFDSELNSLDASASGL